MVKLIETKAEMSSVAEVGKTWRGLKSLTQDRYEWRVCAYAPEEAWRVRDAQGMGRSKL